MWYTLFQRLFKPLEQGVPHLYQPLTHTQFCIQNRAAGRATNGIVAEQNKFIAEDGTAAQSPNSYRHAMPCITITQRLWAVWFTTINKCLFWSARQSKSLRFRRITLPGRYNLFWTSSAF